MQITMVGHSTVLIEMVGMRILTDPWFGSWGNPAFARRDPPAIPRELLRNVDGVLLSHNHWDHRDSRYFRSLPETIPVFVPSRSAWLSHLHGVRTTEAMLPWQHRQLGVLSITAVPAVHVATTIGFVVRSQNASVYFAGDTFYGPWMARIGEELRPDVALMPVTTFRIPMTVGEQGAVKAVTDLRPSVVIPIHLGLQPRMPLLRTKDSPEGFARRVREANLPAQVVVLRPGESWRTETRGVSADPAGAGIPEHERARIA